MPVAEVGTPRWKHVETADRDEALGLLAEAYGSRFRLSSSRGDYTLRHTRVATNLFSLDSVFIKDMELQVDPPGNPMICQIDGGRVEHEANGRSEQFRAGDALLLTDAVLSHPVRCQDLWLRVVVLDPALLLSVTNAAPNPLAVPWSFRGPRPISSVAARHWVTTLDYLRQVLANPEATQHPLVLTNAARLLAASALATFHNSAQADHNSALADTSTQCPREATTATLRAATVFMESHVAEDISLSDIARACHVSVRAVQLAFRRHLGTTPTAYLRRLRLDQAHQELLHADPARQTVSGIAARWGFASHSRFTTYYRNAYGVLPSHTLQRK
jgi:AraC-like DNA-binding protein